MYLVDTSRTGGYFFKKHQVLNLRWSGEDNRGDSRVFGELQLQLRGVRGRTVARGAFSAARSTGMERWHATTSSDTPANHGAHLPDERCGYAPFPRRPQQRGVDNARTPNLTTEGGAQNVQQGNTREVSILGIDLWYPGIKPQQQIIVFKVFLLHVYSMIFLNRHNCIGKKKQERRVLPQSQLVNKTKEDTLFRCRLQSDNITLCFCLFICFYPVYQFYI